MEDDGFKCTSCRLMFKSSDEQRTHYKTDLHRFNLKRKVAGLPPIQQEVFDQKVTEIRAKQEENEKPQGWSCDSCNKQYSSENAYKQHMNCKKHSERLATLSQPRRVINGTQLAQQQQTSSAEPATSPSTKDEAQPKTSSPTSTATTEGEGEPTPKTTEQIVEEKLKLGLALKLRPTDCLFCRKSLPTLDKSITHMTKEHGFFIPDIEFLTDLPGLISYLGDKVGIGNACVYCNKTFASAEAVRGHMTSLNHCKLLYDDNGAAELEDFYNFTASYLEGLNNEERARLEAEMAAGGDEESEIKALESFARKNSKAKLSEDGFELVLNDGRVIGHRALSTYYKQKVRITDGGLTESQRIVKDMVSRYQALGWTTRESQHPSGMDSDHLRQRRIHNDSTMRLGVKGNKLFEWRRQYGF
jgi:pre-60S factor REI1